MDADSGRAIELRKPLWKEYQLAYWSKLNDLAYDIAALLTEEKKTGDGAKTGTNTPAPQQPGALKQTMA